MSKPNFEQSNIAVSLEAVRSAEVSEAAQTALSLMPVLIGSIATKGGDNVAA